MKQINKIWLIFLILLPNLSLSQNTANKKVRIIFNIAKEIQWKQPYSINTYNICVFSKQDSIFKSFNEIKNSGELLKGKEIRILKAKTLDDLKQILNIENIQILYVSHKNTDLADTISKLIVDKNILSVFDNAKNANKCVINLLNNPNKYYEINNNNAIRQNLKLSENILVLGADENLLRNMYVDSIRVLRAERQQIMLKLYQIEDQENLIRLNEEELARKKRELDSIERIMGNQINLIKKQKKALYKNQKLLSIQKINIEKHKKIYARQVLKIDSITAYLLYKQSEIESKQEQMRHMNKKLVQALEEVKTKSDFIKLALVIFVILISLLFVLYSRNKDAKKIKAQNIQIQNKNEEITYFNTELEKQQKIVTEKNKILEKTVKEINDSINYAQRIQLALMPIGEILKANFKNYFILYRPRNIVSGDFYWFRQIKDKIIIAVADCTGHGVPGAFMSIMGMNYLSEITNNNIIKPNIILELLREKIIESFDQNNTKANIKDGMDIALAVIDKKEKTIDFAGAYNPLLYISKKDGAPVLTELKADKMPVGIYFKMEKEKHFSLKHINYTDGDSIYLFTDGYKDQIGGKDFRKISKKNFYELILSAQKEIMQIQKNELEIFFDNWLADSPIGQIDDVLVIGINL